MELLRNELIEPLNIFYEEPKPDRWVKFDRYPRQWLRQIIRGKQRPGGVMMIALELMHGLDKINIPYRFNNYAYIKNHPDEIACIIGKPHLLFDRKWKNPVIFGAGIYSHPIERPDLFEKYPNVKRFLVPGNWMQLMCQPYYGDKAVTWPVGIDTEKWKPSTIEKKTDFLIYDKIRWNYDELNTSLIKPLLNTLDKYGYSYQFVRYGNYTHNELQEKVANCKSVIFLCEHETQGLAYQQILATNTPILAWDRGGFWQDPYYYPDKVRYEPVSSVPYWDDSCGIKFNSEIEFEEKLNLFMGIHARFEPRAFILNNLTLEISAEKYLQIYREVEKEIA
jgi:glycosyltransferase involved in cell wall biosynthesis